MIEFTLPDEKIVQKIKKNFIFIDIDIGDSGEVIMAYQNGVIAKHEERVEFTFPATTSTNSIPLTQTDHEVYNTVGIDGSTVTEFMCDVINKEIDIDSPTNHTTLQRIGAWYYFFKKTTIGIQTIYRCFNWVKENELAINQAGCDFHLDNVNPNACRIDGGRIYRLDGSTIISATSNSLQMDYEPVYSKAQPKIDNINKMLNNKKTLTRNDPNNYTEVIFDDDDITPIVTRTHTLAGDVETREEV